MSLNQLLSKLKNNKQDNEAIIPSVHPLYHELINLKLQDILPENIYNRSSISQSKLSIALLFIIIDDFPWESVWRQWILDSESNNNCNIHISIHAKYPERVQSSWIKSKLLNKELQLKPQWGSLQLTQAMIHLLHSAYEHDNNIDFYTFLSESCLPIVSITEMLSRIRSCGDCSWVNYNNEPLNGYIYQQQFIPLKDIIPRELVYRSDQWVLLSRAHVIQMFTISQYFYNKTTHNINESLVNQRTFLLKSLFKHVKVSDEMYIPCLLSILRLIPKSKEVLRRRVTFCDWRDNCTHPETLYELAPLLMIKAREEGCLFIRKVKCNDYKQKKLIIDQWTQLVQHKTSETIGEESIDSNTTSNKRIKLL